MYQDSFVDSLTPLVSYLRRQYNLIAEMKYTYPKFIDTRWLSMEKSTKFLEMHRPDICEYLEAKNPACKPTTIWWIHLIALDLVATELVDVVARLQSVSTFLGQQQAQLEQLTVTLNELCPVAGPHDEAVIGSIDATVSEICR